MNSSQGPEQPNLASGIRIGSHVSILGEQGSYLVTNIDMQRFMVDLIPSKAAQLCAAYTSQRSPWLATI